MKKLFPLFFISILLIGCEKEEYFRSEKGVGKELQGRWKRVRIASSDPQNEIWNFDGGSLTITSDNAKIMSGTYYIHTTLFKVFINVDGISGSCLNGKWQVVRIDDSVLDMVNDDCSGLLEKEFTKM